MCSSRRVSDLSLAPRRLFRRADVAKHYHNPRDARHCDHKDKYNREDQEKIAHRRISLLNPSSGELSLRPIEPQCRALLHNPIRLRYHCIQETDTEVIATNPKISEIPAKAPRLTRARRTAILKALADPRRFELLERIAKASCPLGCSQALAALEISPATLSHHVKELESAGLIEIERAGKFHNLKLRPGVLEALAETLQALETVSCASR